LETIVCIGYSRKKQKNDGFYERGKLVFKPIPILNSISQIPLKLQNRPPSPAKNTKHRFGFRLKPRALPERCFLYFPTLREMDLIFALLLQFHFTIYGKIRA